MFDQASRSFARLAVPCQPSRVVWLGSPPHSPHQDGDGEPSEQDQDDKTESTRSTAAEGSQTTYLAPTTTSHTSPLGLGSAARVHPLRRRGDGRDDREPLEM